MLEEEAKLIYRDPHWYSCRAKETIHLTTAAVNIENLPSKRKF